MNTTGWKEEEKTVNNLWSPKNFDRAIVFTLIGMIIGFAAIVLFDIDLTVPVAIIGFGFLFYLFVGTITGNL